MFYNVLKIEDLTSCEKSFERNELLKNGNSSINIVSLKKDEIIDTHTSEGDAMVLVLKGEIDIHFSAEKFHLHENELIFFKKDTAHKVFAIKDSKFLLVKI